MLGTAYHVLCASVGQSRNSLFPGGWAALVRGVSRLFPEPVPSCTIDFALPGILSIRTHNLIVKAKVATGVAKYRTLVIMRIVCCVTDINILDCGVIFLDCGVVILDCSVVTILDCSITIVYLLTTLRI